MPSPLTVLGAVSDLVSLSTTIMDLTASASQQQFPTLVDIVEGVADEVTDVIYQAQLHELRGWLDAYSEELSYHAIDLAAPFTHEELFHRICERAHRIVPQANAVAHHLAAIVRDEHSRIDAASKAFTMYCTVQTFRVGFHGEVARVARLVESVHAAEAEAAAQKAYLEHEAQQAAETATELLAIIQARRQAVVQHYANGAFEPTNVAIVDRYPAFNVVTTRQFPLYPAAAAWDEVMSRAYLDAVVGLKDGRPASADECVANVVRAAEGVGLGVADVTIQQQAQWYFDARHVIDSYRRLCAQAPARTLGPPASVTVVPRESLVWSSVKMQLSAIVRDGAGNVLNQPVQWTISDDTAAVSDTGQVRGGRPGTITVTASVNGCSGAATVSVISTAVTTLDPA